MKQKIGWLFIGFWWILAALTALWSYHFVDPNLTLFSFPWYTQWQAALWERAQNGIAMAWQYSALLLLWWLVYAWTVWRAYQVRSVRKLRLLSVITLFGIAFLLLLGHNALSHDIFNYIFNAKMITLYQANPHVSVALDFASDPWIRFMHNVHTPAPYGWGWTVVSLLPFALGTGKFVLTYFSMKLFMGIGFGLYIWAIWKLLRQKFPESSWWRWSLVAFHPLILIETLLVGHNDVWMMWPAVLALSWLCCGSRRRQAVYVVGAMALFAFSISIKFVTLLLLPMVVWLVLPHRQRLEERVRTLPRTAQKIWHFIQRYQADIASLLLWIPLLSPRSQQFHPWYLIWSLTFLPFGKSTLWRSILLGLSVTSTLRYLPLFISGWQYTPLIQDQMRLITWSGAIAGSMAWGVWRSWQIKRNKSES